jgi:hypothetical protein
MVARTSPAIGMDTWSAAAALLLCLLAPLPAWAQLGALISPGRLSKAHTKLEGITECQQCHERGRQVSAERCLSCHKPVAERIARKVGVHRNVMSDCVQCHVEHAGVDAELRPFDQARFRHDTETAFKLDGKHARLAQECSTCHKGRSFLEAKTACAACHSDVHKGQLGTSCERCHSTSVSFTAATQAFDHTKTRFPLTGAHRTEDCAACHKQGNYKIAAFSTCASCHKSPHPSQTVSGACASCHATTTWATKRFDHSATKFPLVGKHLAATCTSCHKVSATREKPASGTCATCHADPHKAEFKQDCAACHDERGFTPGKFDHTTTRFQLVDGHAKAACTSCHKGQLRNGPAARMVADFRGAVTACVSCHADPHRSELGQSCETCHSARTFRLPTYHHKNPSDLFSGQHTTVACERCHAPGALKGPAAARTTLGAARFAATPTTCASCHRDVHFGQVGANCERCHSVAAVKFAADRFDHGSASFALTGGHVPLACEKCHASETAVFPSGSGSAIRLKGVSTECVSCHKDVHLGQVAQTCDSCHDTRAFTVRNYTHKNPPKGFFVGPHVKAECASCHKSATATFPAGKGTAMAFKIGTDCVRCHEDVHRGSLGRNCASCHKLTPLASAHRSGLPEWTMAVPTKHPRLAL